MLSILIPVKDYCCTALVAEMQRQCEALDIAYEIIVGEDGSSHEGLKLNSPIDILPHCNRLIEHTNIGRAGIRNRLAERAKGKNIMFIDCDAIPEKDEIVKSYNAALNSCEVVCGGLYHADKQPYIGCELRYLYEKAADKRRSATHRKQKPYDCFTTFCFAIRKELFMQIKFNETITKYGYEDTLFGYELRRKGIEIEHIDAPLLHTGLEKNELYLHKVEQSIESLVTIEKEIGETPLLRCYRRVTALHMTSIVANIWKRLRNQLCKNLYGCNPSLLLLNFYKLGYFCYLKK